MDGEDYVCGLGPTYDGGGGFDDVPLICQEPTGGETDFVAGVLRVNVVLDVGPEWQFRLSIQGVPQLVELVVRPAESEPTEYQFEPTYDPVCFQGREEPLVHCAHESR